MKLAQPNGEIYDDATKTIKFDILLSDPTPEERMAAGGRLLDYFTAFDPTLRNTVTPASVLINPGRLVGYEVRLAVQGRKVVLTHVEAVLSGAVRLPIAEKIDDEEVQAALRQNPNAGTVEFYRLYKIRQAETDGVRIQHIVAATSKAFEKVFGKNPDPAYYVNRDVAAKLEDALFESFNGEFDVRDPAQVAVLQNLLGLIPSKLKDLEPASFDELKAASDKTIVFGPKNLQIEFAPIQIANIVNSDTTHDKVSDKFAKTWNNAYDEAQTCKTDYEFFQKMCTHVQKEKKGEGSIGFGALIKLVPVKLDIKGEGSFWEDEGETKLEGTKLKAVQEFRKYVQNMGSEAQDKAKDFYRELVGSMSTERADAKSVDLVRVEQSSLSRSFTAEIGIVLNKGTITRPYLQQLTLAGNDFLSDKQRFARMLAAERPEVKHYVSPADNLLQVASNPEKLKTYLGVQVIPKGWVIVRDRDNDRDATSYVSLNSTGWQPWDYGTKWTQIPKQFGDKVIAAWLEPIDSLIPKTQNGQEVVPFCKAQVEPADNMQPPGTLTFFFRPLPDKAAVGQYRVHVRYSGPDAK